MMKHPSGILQITPESLESMLLHKHSAVPRLFGDLRFVVIDEVHSLMRGDRGGQTLCVIERLSRMAGVNPRRIGLSATVGDPERTGEFLAAGTGRNTVIPRIDDKGQRWRLSMEHFYISDRQATDDVYGAKKGVARARASAADAEEPAATVDIDTAPEALGDASGGALPVRALLAWATPSAAPSTRARQIRRLHSPTRVWAISSSTRAVANA